MCFTIFLTEKEVNNAMSEIKSPSFPFLTWIKALRGNYVHKEIGNFDKNNWMSRLDGEKYINEISVPGSHDTCALYEPLRELAKCQMYTSPISLIWEFVIWISERMLSKGILRSPTVRSFRESHLTR